MYWSFFVTLASSYGCYDQISWFLSKMECFIVNNSAIYVDRTICGVGAKIWSGRMARESPQGRTLLMKYMARKLVWHHRGSL